MTEAARRVVLLAAVLVLSACAGPRPPREDATGRPCVSYRHNHRSERLCAAQPALTPAQAEAARAAPLPAGQAEVWVHWLRRGEATHPLRLQLDGQPLAELLPAGVVRLRLPPGPHRLAVQWPGAQAGLGLVLAAGESRVFEVDSVSDAWRPGFGWRAGDAEGAARRVAAARLVADLQAPSPGGSPPCTAPGC